MLSRLLTNLILLVIVLTLAFLVYISRDMPSTDSKLTSIDKSSISQITIKHRERTIKLERIADAWRMLEPVVIEANNYRVGSLLDLLSTSSSASYDASTLDLDNYGLTSAQTSISFNQTTMIFGIDNPVNHKRYVLLNNRLHLIGDQFYPLISSQLGTLISTRLLPRDASITKIVLPEQTLELTDSGWRSSDHDIDSDAVLATIDHWRNSQAFGVHDYQVRASLGHIEVSLAGEDKPLLFEITDTDPWLIIARPDLNIEYHFNLEFYDRLLRPGHSIDLPAEFEDADAAPAPPLRPL